MSQEIHQIQVVWSDYLCVACGLGIKMNIEMIKLELLKDNVKKMRTDKTLGRYQEGWDDAVCVVLKIIDVYLHGVPEDE